MTVLSAGVKTLQYSSTVFQTFAIEIPISQRLIYTLKYLKTATHFFKFQSHLGAQEGGDTFSGARPPVPPLATPLLYREQNQCLRFRPPHVILPSLNFSAIDSKQPLTLWQQHTNALVWHIHNAFTVVGCPIQLKHTLYHFTSKFWVFFFTFS